MSVPSPYAQRTPPAESKEDCRDYLRTGRCKYGASCKYNHPANVQSGGGMKTPLDPSEPMFPIRPNEPVCQYYMKHGTCKFGQTCKFHHPPQSSLPSGSINGNALLVGVGRKVNDSPQTLWSSTGGDSNVQLLPQRPDEPNCIFFLKNGRCKYGATCRYHHPLNYHDRRPASDDGRRQTIQVQQLPSDSMPKIHYVTSLPAGSFQQGHFVVADGTVTFVSLDGSTPAQVISVPQGSKETAVVYAATNMNRPLGHSRDVASSSSSASIASSYETANSNLDQMGVHGDSSSSLWGRPRRTGSGGSLNAYISEGNPHGRTHLLHGSRGILVQNGSEGNMNLHRVASTGNTSENGTVYYDASTGMSRQVSGHSQSSNGMVWRGRRSNSFDHTGQGSLNPPNHDGDSHEGSNLRVYDDEALQGYRRDGQRSPMMRGRPPTGSRVPRRPQQNVEVDDGLSMMTSALLTMLDTPEEAAGEHFEGYDYDEPRGSTSQMSTPLMRPEFPSRRDDGSPNSLGDPRHYYQGGQYSQVGSYYDQNVVDDRVLGLMMPGSQNRMMEPRYDIDEHQQKRNCRMNDNPQDWSPNWEGHPHMGRPLQEKAAQSMPVVRSQSSSNSPHSSPPVGLYLP